MFTFNIVCMICSNYTRQRTKVFLQKKQHIACRKIYAQTNQQIKQNSKQYFGKIYKEDFFTTQIENIKEWNK